MENLIEFQWGNKLPGTSLEALEMSALKDGVEISVLKKCLI